MSPTSCQTAPPRTRSGIMLQLRNYCKGRVDHGKRRWSNGWNPLAAGGLSSCIRGGPGGWGLQDTPQVRPCRLRRRIHAAQRPANPTRPAPDSFPMPPAAHEKRKAVERGHAPLPCARRRNEEQRVMDPLYPSPLHPLHILPGMARHYPTPHGPVEGGAGWAGGGVERHGWRETRPAGCGSCRPPPGLAARPRIGSACLGQGQQA